ncbi:MAG TPA: (2Fe-2S)-binding protein [Limnochordales bacterium]|nr:(2Fe-2S)-binding protein [Limnochordales bacterium]
MTAEATAPQASMAAERPKMANPKIMVEATINGVAETFVCEPRQTLLEVLREQLGLTGTKEGCGNGNCGACCVLLDGRPVNSCLVLAVEADGRDIVTIEGLDRDGVHPLQQAFLEHGALQCGICTPGFLMSAKALLDANPRPTEHEVRRWLAGNLCRCTGYDKIIRAVLDAAQRLAAGAADGQAARHAHGQPGGQPATEVGLA